MLPLSPSGDHSTDQDAPVAPICSARGCRAPARHALRWRNPKLHTGDRQKTWTACDDHRERLASFLEVRGFLLKVDPLP